MLLLLPSSSLPAQTLTLSKQLHHSRKLLLHTPVFEPPRWRSSAEAPATASGHTNSFGGFDAGVIIILAALVCTVIWALMINAIIRCAIRVINRYWAERGLGPGRPIESEAELKVLVALPALVYSPGLGLPRVGSECPICLAEFSAGEEVRVMPKCSHGFHARCIDRWLESQLSCPTCRQCLLGKCQKASERAEGRAAQQPQQAEGDH